MENPSASILATPRTMTKLLDNPAPATEETTAKVVTAPSMAPRMESFRYSPPVFLRRRLRIASGVCSAA